MIPLRGISPLIPTGFRLLPVWYFNCRDLVDMTGNPFVQAAFLGLQGNSKFYNSMELLGVRLLELNFRIPYSFFSDRYVNTSEILRIDTS